jgi:hypothetical protein
MTQRKLLQIKAKSEISSDKNSADFTVPASATQIRTLSVLFFCARHKRKSAGKA